jgi:hypothetical protein
MEMFLMEARRKRKTKRRTRKIKMERRKRRLLRYQRKMSAVILFLPR